MKTLNATAAETQADAGFGERLPRPTQESLLALLLYDDAHGGRVVDRIEPHYFEGEYEEIARRVGAYWKKYGLAPKRQTDELFNDIFSDTAEGRSVTYAQLFVHLLELHQSGINVEFLDDGINDFIGRQEAKALVVNAATLLRTNSPDVLETFHRDINTYKDKAEARTRQGATKPVRLGDVPVGRTVEQSTRFTMGVEALDQLNIRPQPGAVMVVLGGLKSGKSFCLQNVAFANALPGQPVLFVTCEMTREEVTERIYMRMYAGARYDGPQEVPTFEGLGDALRIERTVVTPKWTLADESTWPALWNAQTWVRRTAGVDKKGKPVRRQEVDSKGKPVRRQRFGWIENNLHIVEYPPGAAMVADITTHVKGMERAGNKPALVVVDYIEEMKLTGRQEYRHQLRQHVQDMKRLAVDHNLAVVTAQQVNRAGVKSGKPEVTDISEDIGIARVADTVLSIQPQRAAGLVVVKVAVARSQRQGQAVAITQCLGMGRFCVDSRVVDESVRQVLAREAQAGGAEYETGEDAKARRKANDDARAKRKLRIMELAKAGESDPQIARRLADEGFGNITRQAVQKVRKEFAEDPQADAGVDPDADGVDTGESAGETGGVDTPDSGA